MNNILDVQVLSKDTKKMVLEADEIAQKALPGQFVTVIVDENGERIPLTIVETDKEKGTITLIFLEVGKTTRKLGALSKGNAVMSLLGPLGKATKIENLGTVVTIGGGVGIAEVYPVTKAFKDVGNKVISIIGARSKNLLILEKELRECSDELLIATDDGSYGQKGFVTDILEKVIKAKKTPALVYAVGPVPMMQAVSNVTRAPKIKTYVSLNPIMVDATGMCGSCRVRVGGKTKFGCVDGPEFDAHLVDFSELMQRLRMFEKQEKMS